MPEQRDSRADLNLPAPFIQAYMGEYGVCDWYLERRAAGTVFRVNNVSLRDLKLRFHLAEFKIQRIDNSYHVNTQA